MRSWCVTREIIDSSAPLVGTCDGPFSGHPVVLIGSNLRLHSDRMKELILNDHRWQTDVNKEGGMWRCVYHQVTYVWILGLSILCHLYRTSTRDDKTFEGQEVVIWLERSQVYWTMSNAAHHHKSQLVTRKLKFRSPWNATFITLHSPKLIGFLLHWWKTFLPVNRKRQNT